jgi:hypothetical protein
VCVCVCVCARASETGAEGAQGVWSPHVKSWRMWLVCVFMCVCVCARACVCVCVCVSERERERERPSFEIVAHVTLYNASFYKKESKYCKSCVRPLQVCTCGENFHFQSSTFEVVHYNETPGQEVCRDKGYISTQQILSTRMHSTLSARYLMSEFRVQDQELCWLVLWALWRLRQ